MVWGKELYFDATKVQANASLDSLQPRFVVDRHLRELFTDEERDEPAGEDQPVKDSPPAHLHPDLPSDCAGELAEENAARHDWVAEEGRPDREVIRGSYRRLADYQVSSTDPDASPMATNTGGKDIGYHDHYVVDGGKARIITTSSSVPMGVSSPCALSAIEQRPLPAMPAP